MFLLTPTAIISFRLSDNSICFDSVALHEVHFSYELQLDHLGNISAINVKPFLPERIRVETPTLWFAEKVGIDGALNFLTKALKNQEAFRGAKINFNRGSS